MNFTEVRQSLEDAVHVAVPDRVATAALELTVPAGRSSGCADTLGNRFEIQLRVGQLGIGGDFGSLFRACQARLGLPARWQPATLPCVTISRPVWRWQRVSLA
jgi:hypothetical protein